MKTVVFDLDGTLVDSAPDIQASVNVMLEEEGMPPLDLPTVVSFVGNGLPTLVRRVMAYREIPDTEFTRWNARVLAIYNLSTSGRTVVYDGVVETLKGLKSAGMRLAICTNKPEQPAHHVLKAMALDGFFDCIVGGDTLSTRKPDPAPLLQAIGGTPLDEILFVGDSEVDAETARGTKVDFALFTEGYRKTGVKKIAHDLRFSDWHSFMPLLQQSGRL